MTQLESARKGIMTPEMVRVAVRENVTAEFVRDCVARGTVARSGQDALLLVVVGLLAASPTLAQETAKRPAAGRATHDMPLDAYNGKYKDFAPFKKIAARLPQMREAALKKIEQRLGLAAKAGDRTQIELRDALPEDSDRIKQFTGSPFRTSWDGDDIAVILHTEFMVNGRYDVETELLHELTHAVIRSHMTRESYKAVPDWLREGLAVWTAEQVNDKAIYLMRSQDEPAKVSDLLKGLEGGPETLERYAEYGLAIEMIEKKHAGDAVKTLARLLSEGTPARESVEKAAKQTWGEFESDARKYAKERLEQIAPAHIDVYFEMRLADKQRDYKKVIEKADLLLKARSRSPLTSSVLYWRGKACRMIGRTAEAEKTLKELLAKRERASEWVEGALYQLGKARVEAQKFQEAIDPWQRLLRDHPDSDHQDNVVYYLALCRAKTGKKAEARRLLDLFDRSFPSSEYADKARELHKHLK